VSAPFEPFRRRGRDRTSPAGPGAAGFTLVEVLTALAITAGISLLCLQGFRLLDRIQARRAEQQIRLQARLILDRLVTELEQVPAPRPGAPELHLRGSAGQVGEQRRDTLELVALPGPGERTWGATRLRVAPGPAGEPSALEIAREVHGPADAPAEEPAPWEPLLEDVLALRIEYRDAQGWSDSWDSRERGRLPEAVRLELTIALPPDTRDRSAQDRSRSAQRSTGDQEKPSLTLVRYAVPLSGGRW
jgi:prepilin-type N-terminal cleavage/methylation domain-containing protein